MARLVTGPKYPVTRLGSRHPDAASFSCSSTTSGPRDPSYRSRVGGDFARIRFFSHEGRAMFNASIAHVAKLRHDSTRPAFSIRSTSDPIGVDPPLKRKLERNRPERAKREAEFLRWECTSSREKRELRREGDVAVEWREMHTMKLLGCDFMRLGRSYIDRVRGHNVRSELALKRSFQCVSYHGGFQATFQTHGDEAKLSQKAVLCKSALLQGHGLGGEKPWEFAPKCCVALHRLQEISRKPRIRGQHGAQ